MMNKTTLGAAMAVLGIAGAAHASQVDTQARFGASAGYNAGHGFTLQAATEQRWNQDAGEWYHQDYDIGVSYKVNDYLAIAPVFRFYESRKTSKHDGNGEWAKEYRPMLNVTLACKPGGWKIENRSRFEWRIHDNADSDAKNVVRYRNRLKVTAPWKWTELKITPYGSVEIFQDVHGEKTALQNYEAALGLSAALTGWMSVDVYYMAEFKEDRAKHATPHTANIIGAAVKFSF